MPASQIPSGKSESLTPETAASGFEGLLSDMDDESSEDTQANESPNDDVAEGSEPLEDAEESDDVVEGDDVPDDVDDEAPKPGVRKIKVKDNGQDVELPEEEVAAGYMKGKDYTQKTQAVAEKDKALEAERVAVRGEREQYATQLTQLADALKNMTPAEPDWDALRQENPNEFAATWASWQQHLKRMEKVEEARKKAVDAVTTDQIAHMRAHLASESEKLLETIPSWKDEAVAKKEKAELNAYAKGLGYTDQELDQVYDHRVMNMLRKAMLFDKAEKAKPAVRAKIDAVKAATPGNANVEGRRPTVRARAEQRFAKTGSVRDAAVVFESFIDD